MKVLVTGATGFIGGHVVEELRARAHDVVALVRKTSKPAVLEKAGAELALGDITDQNSLERASEGVDAVVHTAAVVGTYGGWERFQRIGVDGTQHMIDAAASAAVERFVHLSSIAVYGLRGFGRPVDELVPLDDHPEPWNHYTREKVLSERLVWKAHEAGRIKATTLRPSVVLGVRDRNVVGRFVRASRLPVSGTIGLGFNRVPCVVVDELARGTVDALESDVAIGQAYNLSGRATITQRQLVSAFSRACGHRRPLFPIPAAVSLASSILLERAFELGGIESEPPLTALAVGIFGVDVAIDCSRAERDLGWLGNADYHEAIEGSVRWFREHGD